MAKGKNSPLGLKQREYSDGGICSKCKHHYPRLTVEHIVPSSILVDLGLGDLIYDDPENMEPMCKGCNLRKGGHLDPLHPKTHVLLAKYVKQSYSKYRRLLTL